MNDNATAKDDLLIHFEKALVSHARGWITDLELGRWLIDKLARSGASRWPRPS
jgi:hypothetical protein